MVKLEDLIYKEISDKDTVQIYINNKLAARGNWFQDNILAYIDRQIATFLRTSYTSINIYL